MARNQSDPLFVPDTGEAASDRLARSLAIEGTLGQAYVARRGVSVAIANAAGARFDADWCGRPALLFALYDDEGRLTSVHVRFLHTVRGQDKMQTIGPGGGVFGVGDGCRADPLIIVEGAFDALSLAVCGRSCIATLGRWAPWLPAVCRGRTVLLAFDGNRPGDNEAARYLSLLPDAHLLRLRPPLLCKDWNTALVKRGQVIVTTWLRDNVGTQQANIL